MTQRLPPTIVLMYHRVADEACDPWGLCVTPEHFAEQLDVLRGSARVVPLTVLPELARSGASSPEPVVAITFDDGYVDNVQAAGPLLAARHLPATFFIVADAVGGLQEFWWDELDRVLLGTERIPSTFSITVDGIRVMADFSSCRTFSESDRERFRGWRAWEAAPTARHDVYFTVWKLLRGQPSRVRASVLLALRRWAQVPDSGRPHRRALSFDQLRGLAGHPFIDVGCHTATHPQLSALPIDEQAAEIDRSRRFLEEVLSQSVRSFAYPYGSPDDYTAETVSVVRNMGFEVACTTSTGQVTADSDPVALPRMNVEDWDGASFRNRLEEWLRTSRP